MARRKKKQKINKPILFGGLALFLLFLVLGTYFLIIPQATVFTLEKTCPTQHTCEATPFLECSKPTYTPKVTLRATGGDYRQRDNYIVIDTNDDGAVDRCFSTGSTVEGGGCYGKLVGYLPGTFDRVMYYSDENTAILCIAIETQRRNSFNIYLYQERFDCEFSQTPVVGWEGKEFISDQELKSYSCSEEILIDNDVKGTLSWNKNTPTPFGGYEGNTYRLREGQKFEFDGKINWEQTFIEAEPEFACNTDVGKLQIGQKACDGRLLLECKLADETPILEKTDCAIDNLKCDPSGIASCEPPYTVNILVNDVEPEENKVIQIMRASEIKIEFTINEIEQNIRREVIATIEGEDTDTDFSREPNKLLVLEAPNTIGFYDLAISMNHPDVDYLKEFEIQVIEPISIQLSPINPIQFDNQLIKVKALITQSGASTNLVDWDWETYIFPQNRRITPAEEYKSGTGVYISEYDITGENTLRARFKAQHEKGGIWTDWTDWVEVRIREAGIIIETDFVSDVEPGYYINKFKTKDPSGNLIDTSNIVSVISQKRGLIVVPVDGSNGEYSFSYNFDDGDLYRIKIKSTNPELGTQELNNGIGETINVFKKGSEGINIMYVVLVVFIVGIIGLGYIIYRQRGKKN